MAKIMYTGLCDSKTPLAPKLDSSSYNDTIPTVVGYMRLPILCRSSLNIHDLLSSNALLAQNLFFKNGNLKTD